MWKTKPILITLAGVILFGVLMALRQGVSGMAPRAIVAGLAGAALAVALIFAQKARSR